jgi:hypothetical protein
MATTKIERAGVSFSVGRPVAPVTIEVRLNHDTIPALRGVRLSFELLNGLTLAQAKKLLDVLNEKVVGMVAITSLSDQTKAAAASEVATEL